MADLLMRVRAGPQAPRHWSYGATLGVPTLMIYRLPLTTACRQLFGIELQPQHVWELDSSQPNKFSRHVVVCLPRAAFACSATVGAFVAQLLARREVSSGSVDPQHTCVSNLPCICMLPVCQGFWLLCAGGAVRHAWPRLPVS